MAEAVKASAGTDLCGCVGTVGVAKPLRGIPSSEGFGDAYRTYTAAQVRSCRSFDRLGHDLSSACRSDRRPSFPPAVAARLGRGRRTRSLSLPLVWPPRA